MSWHWSLKPPCCRVAKVLKRSSQPEDPWQVLRATGGFKRPVAGRWPCTCTTWLMYICTLGTRSAPAFGLQLLL